MSFLTSPGIVAASLTELWSPRVVAEVDDAYVKVAKVRGSLAWHSHDHEDELFFVLKGHLRIEMDGQPGRTRRGRVACRPQGCPSQSRRRRGMPPPAHRAEVHAAYRECDHREDPVSCRAVAADREHRVDGGRLPFSRPPRRGRARTSGRTVPDTWESWRSAPRVPRSATAPSVPRVHRSSARTTIRRSRCTRTRWPSTWRMSRRIGGRKPGSSCCRRQTCSSARALSC